MQRRLYRFRPIATLLLACSLVSSVLAQSPPQDQAGYVKEVTTWREENETKLKSPFGWLALIGHHRLNEGENVVSSASDATISVPEDVSPPGKTVFRVTAGVVNLECDRKSSIQVNGKPVTKTLLEIDPVKPETDGADLIMIGDRVKLLLVRRAGKLAVRVRDSKSERLQKFNGKKWFDVDPCFRVAAQYTPYTPPKTVDNKNVRGDLVPMKIVGQLRFSLSGTEYTLDAFEEVPNELFIVFRDETSGKTTYGSGRFLNAALSQNDQVVILDFNKAYNPPCAFSPHALCPLPPPQNILSAMIEAGERYEHPDESHK